MEKKPDVPAPDPSEPRQVVRMPCPRCRQPSLVEVRRVEPALKMGLLVVLLAWTAGVGWPLVLACAGIVVAAWPPRRRWACERLADCGYEQPVL